MTFRWPDRSKPLPAACAVWIVFACAALVLAWQAGGPQLSTDEAMRLVQLRDLLHGQSWFDLTQHRMNTPYGLSMHWTRLVDAGLLTLAAAGQMIWPGHGEAVALWSWPVILFLPALLALARIGRTILGARGAVVLPVLALLCPPMLRLFAPGSIDHHNAQLVCVLWMLALLLERRAMAGLWLGLMASAGLAIGLETLPFVLVALVLAGLCWIADPRTERGFLRELGYGLACGGAFWFFTVTDATLRWSGACDTYSDFYAAGLIVTGLGFAFIAHLPALPGMAGRWFAMVLLALLAMGACALIQPACFAGPYAQMDPALQGIWLDRINEAQNLPAMFRMAPNEVIGGYLYALFGLAALVWFAGRARFGAPLLQLVAFAAMALALTTLQFRGLPYAVALALPGYALAAIAVLDRFRSSWFKPLAGAAILFVGSGLFFALLGAQAEGQGALDHRVARFQRQIACGSKNAMQDLAALPPGRVAAFVDQGPAILAYTAHQAVAGPYHRDARGIRDSFTLFAGNPREAQAMLAARGIAYVMACRGAPDWQYYLDHAAPGALILRLARDDPPAWLNAVAGHNTDLLLFRVNGLLRD